VPGEVLLEVGDRVAGDTVVARAPGRGRLHTVNAARILDILPGEVPGAMVVAVGDQVTAQQPLARSMGFFGFLAAVCRAPVSGQVAAISPHTGRILLEEPADPLEVCAFLPGIVTEVLPERGVVVAGWAGRIAGVFGVGGERRGALLPVVRRPGTVLEGAMLDSSVEGKVLVAGSLATADALQRASELGAVGVITGGVDDLDLQAWLGQSLVLADTTGLAAPLTLVVVGGFGRTPMDPETFALLLEHEGHEVGLTGQTRVRAGALRPELIIPLATDPEMAAVATPPPPLAVGSRVQIVRAPWFCQRGTVGRLPGEVRRVESEAQLLVAEVDLEDGRTVTVPRTNLEVLSGPERRECP
jgi:hypothetical protein